MQGWAHKDYTRPISIYLNTHTHTSVQGTSQELGTREASNFAGWAMIKKTIGGWPAIECL